MKHRKIIPGGIRHEECAPLIGYAVQSHLARHGLVQVHMWYNLAEAQIQKNGIRLRDGLAKDMPLEQIAEAQRLTREWLAQHQK